MGYGEAVDLTVEQLLLEVERVYHVYHIHFNQGSYKQGTHSGDGVINAWKQLLRERVIICEDYNTVAEIVATTVAMIHGVDMDEFTKQFDDTTASAVRNALAKTDTHVATRKKTQEGVITL